MRRPAAVALAGLALLACGGDELDRSELVQRGDEICSELDAKLGQLGTPADLAQLAEMARRAKPMLSEAVDDLRELDGPSEQERDMRSALQLLDDQVDLSDDLIATAARGDEDAVRAVATRGDRLERRSDRLLRRVGFKQCGKAR